MEPALLALATSLLLACLPPPPPPFDWPVELFELGAAARELGRVVFASCLWLAALCVDGCAADLDAPLVRWPAPLLGCFKMETGTLAGVLGIGGGKATCCCCCCIEGGDCCLSSDWWLSVGPADWSPAVFGWQSGALLLLPLLPPMVDLSFCWSDLKANIRLD